jgi:hypothetical protein
VEAAAAAAVDPAHAPRASLTSPQSARLATPARPAAAGSDDDSEGEARDGGSSSARSGGKRTSHGRRSKHAHTRRAEAAAGAAAAPAPPPPQAYVLVGTQLIPVVPVSAADAAAAVMPPPLPARGGPERLLFTPEQFDMLWRGLPERHAAAAAVIAAAVRVCDVRGAPTAAGWSVL